MSRSEQGLALMGQDTNLNRSPFGDIVLCPMGTLTLWYLSYIFCVYGWWPMNILYWLNVAVEGSSCYMLLLLERSVESYIFAIQGSGLWVIPFCLGLATGLFPGTPGFSPGSKLGSTP